MALTDNEKQEALDMAKGMLLAQKDNLSLASNILNNPHFAGVPHRVKLEALRQYAGMENTGEYEHTVNIEPDKSAIAKSVATSALKDGSLSLPLAAVLAFSSGTKMPLPNGDGFEDVFYRSKKARNSFMRKAAPLAGALFASNAVVGGIREYLKQKGKVEEARMANDYLNRVRANMSDAEMNAMLFGTSAKNTAIRKSISDSQESLSHVTSLNPNVISLADIHNPDRTSPGQMMSDILSEAIEKKSSENYGFKIKSSKPPKIVLPKTSPTPLRNTNTTPAFKAQAVKIRNEQSKEFSSALTSGNSGHGDADAQFRTAKAAVKKLLRM